MTPLSRPAGPPGSWPRWVTRACRPRSRPRPSASCRKVWPTPPATRPARWSRSRCAVGRAGWISRSATTGRESARRDWPEGHTAWGWPACASGRGCSAALSTSSGSPPAAPISGWRCRSATELEMPSPTDPVRVLVVDDHPMVREGLRSMLGGDGVSVTAEAASGAEALRRAAERDIDVVLLDLELPDMDGLAVLRRLREVDARLPVLVVTMHQDPALVRRTV